MDNNVQYFFQFDHLPDQKCCSPIILLKQPSEENGGLNTDILVEDETGEKFLRMTNLFAVPSALTQLQSRQTELKLGGHIAIPLPTLMESFLRLPVLALLMDADT